MEIYIHHFLSSVPMVPDKFIYGARPYPKTEMKGLVELLCGLKYIDVKVEMVVDTAEDWQGYWWKLDSGKMERKVTSLMQKINEKVEQELEERSYEGEGCDIEKLVGGRWKLGHWES